MVHLGKQYHHELIRVGRRSPDARMVIRDHHRWRESSRKVNEARSKIDLQDRILRWRRLRVVITIGKIIVPCGHQLNVVPSNTVEHLDKYRHLESEVQ